jgi:hypothetical protein
MRHDAYALDRRRFATLCSFPIESILQRGLLMPCLVRPIKQPDFITIPATNDQSEPQFLTIGEFHDRARSAAPRTWVRFTFRAGCDRAVAKTTFASVASSTSSCERASASICLRCAMVHDAIG